MIKKIVDFLGALFGGHPKPEPAPTEEAGPKFLLLGTTALYQIYLRENMASVDLWEEEEKFCANKLRVDARNLLDAKVGPAQSELNRREAENLVRKAEATERNLGDSLCDRREDAITDACNIARKIENEKISELGELVHESVTEESYGCVTRRIVLYLGQFFLIQTWKRPIFEKGKYLGRMGANGEDAYETIFTGKYHDSSVIEFVTDSLSQMTEAELQAIANREA